MSFSLRGYRQSPTETPHRFLGLAQQRLRLTGSVRKRSDVPVHLGHNLRMLELLVIALLVWLWVVERRIHSLTVAVKTFELDLQGLRGVQNTAGADMARLRKSVDRLSGGSPATDLPDEPAPKGSIYTEIVATLPH